MSVYEQKKRVSEDPDYVALKRFEFSLLKLIDRYPEGCPDKVIAQALLVSEEEVEELYQKAIARLRLIMGVES
jgi:hypothetical protein